MITQVSARRFAGRHERKCNMKKKWILSGLLALCLCLAWIPCAYADEYIALGSYTAGSELDCPIANVIGEVSDGIRIYY